MSSLRRSHSSGSIPFLWEHRPGVSKVAAATAAAERRKEGTPPSASKPWLPLPPGPVDSDKPAAARKRSGKGAKRVEDDPFLAAYMECTNGEKKGDGQKRKKKAFGTSFLFCKFECGEVREDGMMTLENKKTTMQRSK